jgi:HD-like signal output (HDOD) protein
LAHAAGIDEQEAWLTGMLLRLGEIVIAQHSPASIEAIELRPCAPGERWKREEQATGFNEGQIMAEVTFHWDFPEQVSEALRHCAQPMAAASFSRLGAVVHLAALLADQNSNAADALNILPKPVTLQLGLNVEQLQGTYPDPESFSDISMM